MSVQMPEFLIDTLMNEIPMPDSTTSEEIPQEGIYNQYASQTAKEVSTAFNEPFIHSLSSVPLSTEYFELPADVVIYYINVAVNAGGAVTVALNNPLNIIIDGSLGGNFAIPQWHLKKGEKLYTSVLNCGVHWIGIYLK